MVSEDRKALAHTHWKGWCDMAINKAAHTDQAQAERRLLCHFLPMMCCTLVSRNNERPHNDLAEQGLALTRGRGGACARYLQRHYTAR